ncbi:MAG: LPS export ABC transporter permease LptF [Planctomycetes bacterium]|nr:LPS export ABC transporter permease LptF [Planctomycetota bacterium]
MTILERHLIRETARPVLAVFAILVFVFGGYSAAEFLGQAASGLLSSKVILLLVALKVAIACELLLPIATYLTLVIGLGRLAASNETVAMAFAGLGGARVLRAIARIGLVVAILSGLLSLWIRPLAYARSYAIRAETRERLDLDRLEPGTFFSDDEGKLCVFVDHSDQGESAPPRIFIFKDDERRPLALTANQVVREGRSDRGRELLLFRDLEVYQLGGDGESMRVSNESMQLELPEPDYEAEGQKRKAMPTLALLDSDDPKEIAELQWRLSRPVSSFLLALLALLLSRGRRRRDRYARILLAVLAYVAYFNLAALLRNQVEQGSLPAIPGMFWVDLLLALILVIGLVVPLVREREA